MIWSTHTQRTCTTRGRSGRGRLDGTRREGRTREGEKRGERRGGRTVGDEDEETPRDAGGVGCSVGKDEGGVGESRTGAAEDLDDGGSSPLRGPPPVRPTGLIRGPLSLGAATCLLSPTKFAPSCQGAWRTESRFVRPFSLAFTVRSRRGRFPFEPEVIPLSIGRTSPFDWKTKGDPKASQPG